MNGGIPMSILAQVGPAVVCYADYLDMRTGLHHQIVREHLPNLSEAVRHVMKTMPTHMRQTAWIMTKDGERFEINEIIRMFRGVV